MDLNILISGLTTEDVPCTIPLAGVGVHTDRVALAHLARPLELGEKFITQKKESVVTLDALTLQVFMYDAK